MSRKTDLEQNIRESYQLINDYERIQRLSDNPKEIARAEYAIVEQQKLIEKYRKEYSTLHKNHPGLNIPKDIAEISGVITSEECNQNLRKTSAKQFVPVKTEMQSNTRALFIGINEYQNLPPLSMATKDASDLYNLFVEQGYHSANLQLLVDDQVTYSAIDKHLDQMARHSKHDDTVLIFFSGHGLQRVGGLNRGEYLCPVDADLNNLQNTAISDKNFSDALNSISSRRIVVVIDACHSGGVGQLHETKGRIRVGLSDRAYQNLTKGEGRVLIASCKPSEVSWELSGMNNSLFTHYLLNGLRGAATDEAGRIGILNLFNYVSSQVSQHEPKQNPILKVTGLDDNFPIMT